MSPAATVHHPTPAEIRKACRGIQETWSAEERRNRALGLVDDLAVSLTELAISTRTLTCAGIHGGSKVNGSQVAVLAEVRSLFDSTTQTNVRCSSLMTS